jgi:hypothetical protein
MCEVMEHACFDNDDNLDLMRAIISREMPVLRVLCEVLFHGPGLSLILVLLRVASVLLLLVLVLLLLLLVLLVLLLLQCLLFSISKLFICHNVSNGSGLWTDFESTHHPSHLGTSTQWEPIRQYGGARQLAVAVAGSFAGTGLPEQQGELDSGLHPQRTG